MTRCRPLAPPPDVPALLRALRGPVTPVVVSPFSAGGVLGLRLRLDGTVLLAIGVNLRSSPSAPQDNPARCGGAKNLIGNTALSHFVGVIAGAGQIP